MMEKLWAVISGIVGLAITFTVLSWYYGRDNLLDWRLWLGMFAFACIVGLLASLYWIAKSFVPSIKAVYKYSDGLTTLVASLFAGFGHFLFRW